MLTPDSSATPKERETNTIMLRDGPVVEAMPKPDPSQRVAFMASKDDFREVRKQCALACAEYNKLAEDATTKERVSKWLK